jgi:F420-0:gamma-glutamyl ligase
VSNKPISIQAIATAVFKRDEDLGAYLISHLKDLNLEGKVLAVTSKIVSLAEGRLVPQAEISKQDLVRREADRYLGVGGYGVDLTIKHGLLIPAAGIDESNSENGDFILYPENPYASAEAVWRTLRDAFGLKNFGVVLTDSHVLPLRLGVTGIGLSHWGFKATRSLVNKPDLFDRPLKFTYVDVIDSLAAMAVFAMGESNDQTPVALISGAALEFSDSSSAAEISIEPENDLYWPLLKKLF